MKTPSSVRRRALLLGALIPTLLVAGCERPTTEPTAAPVQASTRANAAITGTTQLVYYNFQNGSTGPTSVASSLVAATNITKQVGIGVSELGTHVDNFGGDWIYRFLSGVYEYTPRENYSAFKVGLRGVAACPVIVTAMRFELEHNTVGRPAIGGMLEQRSSAGALIASYPFTINGGFAINNPPRITTVPLDNVVLGATNTFFLLRMHEDINGTESQYTAQLFLDEVSFEGRQNCAPTLSVDGPATAIEGSAVSFTASADDADGDALAISWDFGDGSTASGAQPAPHTYADQGTYLVTVTSTDGIASVQRTHSVTVTNAAPSLTSFTGATIFAGETYSVSGSFTDPGADSHTATVDYGAGPSPLSLSDGAFAISSVYSAPGSYTVTVTVSDEDGGVGSSSALVTVLSAARAAEEVVSVITAAMPASDAKPLIQSLAQVTAALDDGNRTSALGKLGAFDNKLNAALNSGKISAATHAKIADYSRRIRSSIG